MDSEVGSEGEWGDARGVAAGSSPVVRELRMTMYMSRMACVTSIQRPEQNHVNRGSPFVWVGLETCHQCLSVNSQTRTATLFPVQRHVSPVLPRLSGSIHQSLLTRSTDWFYCRSTPRTRATLCRAMPVRQHGLSAEVVPVSGTYRITLVS